MIVQSTTAHQQISASTLPVKVARPGSPSLQKRQIGAYLVFPALIRIDTCLPHFVPVRGHRLIVEAPVVEDLMYDFRNQLRSWVLHTSGMCLGDLILGDGDARMLEEKLNERDQAQDQENLHQDDDDGNVDAWSHYSEVVRWWL